MKYPENGLICSKCGGNARFNTPMLDNSNKIICGHCQRHTKEYLRGISQFPDENGNIKLVNKFQKYGIVIWLDNNKITSVWIDYGATAWKLRNIEKNATMSFVFEYIHGLVKKGYKRCNDCGKTLTNDEIAGSHFAGNFCEECWEKYKKHNNGTCRLCRQPYYKCVC